MAWDTEGQTDVEATTAFCGSSACVGALGVWVHQVALEGIGKG